MGETGRKWSLMSQQGQALRSDPMPKNISFVYKSKEKPLRRASQVKLLSKQPLKKVSYSAKLHR
jgi:hypothetical protein